MDKLFVRNYLVFFVVLVVCMGGSLSLLLMGRNAITIANSWVIHSNKVIMQADKISTLSFGMLASQRDYIATGQEIYLKRYADQKKSFSDILAMLSVLVEDNPAQNSRLEEMRNNFTEFTNKIEEQTSLYGARPQSRNNTAPNADVIISLRDNILRLDAAILDEENKLLQSRLLRHQQERSTYFSLVFTGIILSSAMLLLLNGFLLNARRENTRIEGSLKRTEERFALAVEAMQDGIFDWDIQTDKVFYSKQFFKMLGYDRSSGVGTPKDFLDLIHPEDEEPYAEYTQRYIKGAFSDYNQEFRLKNNDGRWVWIKSRAKGVYDNNGKVVRLIGAYSDISTIKERESRLEQAKKFAEAANQAKGDFLAHMSHEIRTPLTAISGIAEIFQKNTSNLDARQQKLVRTLHSSSMTLKDLVNDVLDFSKIENGSLQINKESFDLAELFEEVISMMTVRTNEKAISFVFDYADVKGYEFVNDKMRLRQVLTNLIGNAIKFTSEGGVAVKARKETRTEGDFLRIDVTDTGVGISPENFDLIFERFKQADSSVSRKFGGTGLGLPISRNLAKLMGGVIILSSELGRGSTFSLLLPFDVKNQILLPAPDALAARAKLSAVPVQMNGRILLVDDYEGNVVVLSHLLDEMGYGYDTARNGREAVDLWRNHTYDVILMDVQMPEMDGLTATSTIRTLEGQLHRARTPIIGMTAHAFLEDQNKCLQAGMDIYLAKPVDEENLKRQITNYANISKKSA